MGSLFIDLELGDLEEARQLEIWLVVELALAQ